MNRFAKRIAALLISAFLVLSCFSAAVCISASAESCNLKVTSFNDQGRMTGTDKTAGELFDSAAISFTTDGRFTINIPSSQKTTAKEYDMLVGGTGYYQMPAVTVTGVFEDENGNYYGGVACKKDGEIINYSCVDTACSQNELPAGRGGGAAGREHIFRVSKAIVSVEYSEKNSTASFRVVLKGDYVGLPNEYADWEAVDSYDVTYYLEAYSPPIGSADEIVSEQEEPVGNLNISGIITDGAGVNMKGVSVSVELYDENSPESDSITVNTRTNRTAGKRGVFAAHFDFTGMEKPMVRITVKLDYISDDNNVLLNFTDGADKYGVNEMCVESIFEISENDIKKLKEGGQADIFGIGSFAYLRSKSPFFFFTGGKECDYSIGLEDEITVSASLDKDITLTSEERISDASILYTAAQAAHQYTEIVLGEKEAMNSSKIKIILHDKETERSDSAFFRYTDNTIHIGSDVSTRSDDSVFTIMHEFGHAVDHLTTENGRYHIYTLREENNHDGIFNSTMCDSYTEGFATFFAALVRKSLGSDNPERMPRADLTLGMHNYAYQTSQPGYGYEENSISCFLWMAANELGTEKNGKLKIWHILSDEHDYFQQIYNDIVKEAGQEKKDLFDTFAYSVGLFSMPQPGNGKYDEGEPYQDINKNGVYDDDEPYYDMIYTWEYDTDTHRYNWTGTQEGKEIDFNDLNFGITADYNRRYAKNEFSERFSKAPPESGYLELELDEDIDSPYVLVTVTKDDGTIYKNLCAAASGKILLFDTCVEYSGKVKAEIPGGSVIFEGDVKELSKKAFGENASPILAEARITKNDMPENDVVYTPTFGSSNASGYIIPTKLNDDEIKQQIEAQNEENAYKSIFEGTTARYHGNRGSRGDEKPEYKKTNKLNFAVMIIAVIGILSAVSFVIILISLIRKGKASGRSPDTSQTAAPVWENQMETPRFCSYCGQRLYANAKFCHKCGRQKRNS